MTDSEDFSVSDLVYWYGSDAQRMFAKNSYTHIELTWKWKSPKVIYSIDEHTSTSTVSALSSQWLSKVSVVKACSVS